jgi:hypothetical protein
MLRAMRSVSVGVITVLAIALPATAQPRTGGPGPVFRVEPEKRTDHTRPGFVTGWLYNDGQGVAGLVRMKVEMLDDSGKVVAEHIGWAYGNVIPGGRAYFMIPIPPKSSPERRVIVESFIMQSVPSAPTESP